MPDMSWQADGRAMSISFTPQPKYGWITWHSDRIVLPAGTYTVYGIGSDWSAFTVYDDSGLLTRVDYGKALLKLHEEKAVILHIGFDNSTFKGSATCESVILEGDWTTV